MEIKLFLLILAISMAVVMLILLTILKNSGSNHLIKYIPAIVFAVGIILCWLKMLFISEGFEGIYDILLIRLLAILLLVSLLPALFIDLKSKWITKH